MDLAEQIYTTGSSSSLFPKIGLHRCYFMTFSDIFEKKKLSKLRHSKTAVRRYFTKNEFLKIVKISQENSFAGVSFSAKLQVGGLQLYQKRNPTQIFSSKFYKIFKNTFFIGDQRATALCIFAFKY